MLHRLCEPPSIPLSFSLATILPRRGTSRFRYGRGPIGEPPTQCPSFTARTTGVSNPVRSPGFRVSASVSVQDLAFATGVPSDLNAFHRSTGSSRSPYAPPGRSDRKSTRLNSSHSQISYAVFCLKKKKKQQTIIFYKKKKKKIKKHT